MNPDSVRRFLSGEDTLIPRAVLFKWVDGELIARRTVIFTEDGSFTQTLYLPGVPDFNSYDVCGKTYARIVDDVEKLKQMRELYRQIIRPA